MAEDFEDRLKQAFGFATMAAIARRLGIPHATIRNYFRGRMPAPDVLIKIANETNVSLNWLLIGTGEMLAADAPKPDIGKLIDLRIEEIVEEKLSARFAVEVQDLGAVDIPPNFDIAAAVTKYDDPHRAMSEWFRHEGREYPQDYGIVFFQGWETFTAEEKLDAVKDAKKVLDRTLKNK
ncbi:MAG: helix-turn-helix domain-containing protein [Saprospiraceae bacterium]|nr:helix-turn-helix domain-containing protein [Pyrinomonadaceae bacterium]